MRSPRRVVPHRRPRHARRRGWLTIVGRLKDVIIRGGENIAISEVEAVLEAHPSVRQRGRRRRARTNDSASRWSRSSTSFPARRSVRRVPLVVRGTGRGAVQDAERIVVVDEIPMMAAGKADRQALPRCSDGARPRAAHGCSSARPVSRAVRPVVRQGARRPRRRRHQGRAARGDLTRTAHRASAVPGLLHATELREAVRVRRPAARGGTRAGRTARGPRRRRARELPARRPRSARARLRRRCGPQPAVVFCSITGYGQDGPTAGRRAYAPVMHAELGLMEFAARRFARRARAEAVSHADLYSGCKRRSASLPRSSSAPRPARASTSTSSWPR